MYFFENKISIENRDELEIFLTKYPHRTSGLTFTSLYMWRNENDFSYEVINDFLCVAGRTNFEGFQEEPFIFPLLPRNGICDKDKLRLTMEELLKRFKDKGYPFVMRLIPIFMQMNYKDALPGQTLFLPDRPNDDYVYLINDLAELKGKKFHSKKNHVNRFNKEYEGRYEVKPMSSEYAEEALQLLAYIDAKKDVEGFEKSMLGMEAEVLNDVIPKFELLGMEGCAIFIDGKLQAYAFGGHLGDDTIVEHVEKGNIEYDGIYQKVNQEFCKMFQQKYQFVNREEDMGLAGLRKAKMSYKPFERVKKSIMMMKDDEEAIKRYSEVEPLPDNED